MDWITNKLYFTDAALDIIGVVDPSGSYNYTILINTGDNTQPRAIVLDPNRRWVGAPANSTIDTSLTFL